MEPASFPVILTYHSISGGVSPTQISTALFTAHMQWLHDHARVVPLGDVLAALRNGKGAPQRMVALTFDDGYSDFYSSAAPVLRRLKLPATVFVPTALRNAGEPAPKKGEWCPQGTLLNWQQVNELAGDGFEFGSHSITHPVLTDLPPEQANHEIRGSRLELEQCLGRRVTFFAYPYGRWNDSVRDLVQRHYSAACSTGAGVVMPDSDPFALPRVDAHYVRTPAALRSMFTARFLAYVATRRLIRRVRRQPEGIYSRV